MVLKKILPNIKDQRGKWAPNYEGPYVVKQAFSGGALILTNAEGQDLKHPINVDSIKILTRVSIEAPTPEWCKRKAREVRHQGNVTNPQSLALGQGTDPNHEIVPTETPLNSKKQKKKEEEEKNQGRTLIAACLWHKPSDPMSALTKGRVSEAIPHSYLKITGQPLEPKVKSES
ncbi:hypothetical protein CR513_01504, partial [Mucuna pruriens]